MALSAAPTTAPDATADQLAQPLEQLFDNTAVSDDTAPSAADFDGSGSSLSAQDLAAAGWSPGATLTVQGAELSWPRKVPGRPDNVRAAGQPVHVTGRGDALAFLVAGTGEDTSGTGTVAYADGTTTDYRLTAPDWRTGPLPTKAVALPHINTPGGQLAEQARLYVLTVPLAPGREVVSVRLPYAGDLHVFALSVRSGSPGWTGTWAAGTSGHPAVGPWTDATLRLVVHTSAGGPRVRLRFDNTFAGAPVRIGSATVAVQAEGAGARTAPVPVTFRGAAGVSLPAGAQAYSDPVDFDVPADTNLLVSFRLAGTVTALPVHRLAMQRSYVSGPGDHTADVSGAAFPASITYWPLLTGVDVGGGPGSVVLLGDSITDGGRSTADTNRRWPDALSDLLRSRSSALRYGVLNQGISANRLVLDIYPGDGTTTVQGGVSALNRLDRDVFAQTSVRTVVVFEGINDLLAGVGAEQVAAGLTEVADRARARGLRVLAATLLPCGGEPRCTPALQAERGELNTWLRGGGGGFDALLDFDAVLRDPADPGRMLPAYDSGDHLHPGDAGMAALGGSVDPLLL
ncbi:GDSL-type esterase/lipase family protein [Streptomyces sp. NPDC093094]|uniref:SGNH/GDSL hydrolase family protein n=1 Tax=Streptomyces sp. NPDC093094 TaxID=3366026 RepID=UPI00381D8C41